MPVTAIAMPAQSPADGCSPASRLNTGTATPSEATGATTPIVPVLSAA